MNFVIFVIFVVPVSAVLAISCSSGTGSPSSPTSAAVPHVAPQTVMIQEGHAIPEELTIAVGERVTFMNHDRPSYTIAGGREPAGPDCSEIDVVGVLPSGEMRPTEPFTAAKTCVFRVSREASPLLTGRIIIR